MQLTVLGSCGSWPGPGRACSGYLVRTASTAVVLDLGPGTLANLHYHLDIADLDAVVLTHAHPDHWTDLAGLHVGMRHFRHLEALPLFAPAHTLDAVAGLIDSLEPTFVPSPIDIDDPAAVTVGDLALSFAATDHSVPCVAVRVDGPAGSLAYSADTGPNWSFSSLGGDIDVALCEATYANGNHVPQAGHLSAPEAGAMARAAGVGRLVLTHLAPDTDAAVVAAEAAAAFGAPVMVATDGFDLAITHP